jgi:hypothetical protein
MKNLPVADNLRRKYVKQIFTLLNLPEVSFQHVLISLSSFIGISTDFQNTYIYGNFSLHHSVQNGSGAHPASYPMGTRGSFPGGRPGREADHSPPSSAVVKNA